VPRLPKDLAIAGLSRERIKLTPSLIEGFVTLYLMERFDNAKDIPPFHRKMWELFCSDNPLVAIAAPRGHAKSTAVTLACCLAAILFGAQDHVLIIGATEKLASDQMKDIQSELRENEAIVEQFKVRLVVDNETETIGVVGGRMFRIVAKGAEQKVRGIKWRHKRPGLILIDDLEEDEAVQNTERRIKLREWVDNAVIPLGSDVAVIRAVGTILHFDSWLERCLSMKDTPWVSLRFKAHQDFDDFSNILWPEKFSEEKLRMLRSRFISNNNPSGYSQEYLSHPIAEMDAFFQRADFVPMEEVDHVQPKNFYIGVDFAISKADRANQTAMVVGGMDPQNFLHIVDCRTGRWDSLEIIDEMFRLQKEYKPELWILEQGMLEKSLGPVINFEMVRRGVFLNILTVAPTKEKQTRAQGIRARMRAHGVKFDKEAEWYPAYEMEMLQFPRSGKDDRVDATAWLGLYLDDLQGSLTVKELAELEWEEEVAETSEREGGRNEITGY
jgi:predicted phage terminase large subunit-like protein